MRLQVTQSKYLKERFEAVPAKVNTASGATTEWRIKCMDCPGKFYKPGPDGKLSNFE
ncbi:hypothetical protein MPER_15682, partial [Moniliophthora perniciosa FA553]